jgi:hypothetical protein
MKLVPPNITPGPWSARPLDDPQWGIHGKGEWELVANTLHGNDSANAKLIAAAPVMAEALAELCVDAEYALRKFLPPGSYSMSHSLRNALDALKAAGYTVEAADQS